MRSIRYIVLVLLGALSLAGSAAPVPPKHPALLISYRLTPVPRGFLVEMSFTGDASKLLTLELPDQSMGQSDRWQYLSDFTVDGAVLLSPKPNARVLMYKPGAAVHVRYLARSAYASGADGSDGNPYKGALVSPGWFATLGDFIFAIPGDGELWPARFSWGPIPKGYTVASDLDNPGPKTVTDIVESTILGGTDVTLYRRPVPGGTLELAVRGTWSFDVAKLADEMARTVTAQRDFWDGDVKGDYLVTLFQTAGAGSSGGTGRGDGFALYGTADTDETTFKRTIAHEHMHSWIPNRIGRLRDGPGEPADYWFSEGFTDYYAERTLLGAGLWSLEDFVADLNDKLVAYAGSPVHDAPNARIVKEFWTNYPIQQLPYQRGMLLAYLWDWRLRHAGKQMDMDVVMHAARDRFAGARAGAKPYAADNFVFSYARSGIDLAPDLKRYVEDGETVMLPPDLFGDCAAVRTVQIAAFDPGFDRDKSAADGIIAGVDPKGPAYAAGLRDGMKRLRRVGGKDGDSRIPLGYRIADAGGERDIAWLPAGKGMLTLQEVVLAPGMDAGKRKLCVFRMGAGAAVLR